MTAPWSTQPRRVVFSRDGTPTVRLTAEEIVALQNRTPEGVVVSVGIERQLDALGLSYVAWERIDDE